MAQAEDSNGNNYKQKGWLGVTTACKLRTDLRGCNDAMIEERTVKSPLEIANKLDVGECVQKTLFSMEAILKLNQFLSMNSNKDVSSQYNSQYN